MLSVNKRTIFYDNRDICHMRGIAWDLSFGPTDQREVKAILSEAVVTGGEALGNTKDYNCLEDSTLPYYIDDYSTVF